MAFFDDLANDLANTAQTVLANDSVTITAGQVADLSAAFLSYLENNTPTEFQLNQVQPDFELVLLQFMQELSTSNAWQDQITAGTGQAILRFLSAGTVFSMFGVIRALQETMLATAKLANSVFTICRMLGVHILRNRPASLTAILDYSAPETFLEIPPFTGFIVGGINYFNRTPIIFQQGTTSQGVTLYQGTTNSELFISDGSDYQQYVFGSTGFVVSDTDILVTVDGGTPWTRTITGLWHYGPTDTVYYENCVTGNTLIPTENGLIRIDELVVNNRSRQEKLNIKISGRYKSSTAIKWYYNGTRKMFNIKTKQGNSLCCTGNHRLLVFDTNQGETVWKYAKNCKLGDLLCISPRQIVRTFPLNLNLKELPTTVNLKSICKPNTMTPDLSFIIGLILSEGCIQSKKYSVRVTNHDMNLLNKYCESMKWVFNIETAIYNGRPAGTECYIKGIKTIYNYDDFIAVTSSKQLIFWLEDLGINPTLKSKEKQIPWSILQADEESQLAFLAAYLEGDGSVDESLSWHSKSYKIISELQILLNSHGFIPIIYNEEVFSLKLTKNASQILWTKLNKYMVTKSLIISDKNKHWLDNYGIPNEYWKNILNLRKIPIRASKGTPYIQDDGSQILVRLSEEDYDRTYNNLHRNKKFNYHQYNSGKLNALLSVIETVSLQAYKKLKLLLDLQYCMTPITEILNHGLEPAYDISIIENDDPSYIANGLCVHNSLPGGNVQLEFGNNIYGDSPAANSNILITWAETTGLAGNNLPANQTISCPSFSTISGTSISISGGGDNGRDAAFYQLMAPFIYASHNEAVTRDDYKAIALQYPGVIDALFVGQAEIDPTVLERMCVVEGTTLTTTDWDDTAWNNFLAYLKTYDIANINVLRVDPIGIIADVGADIYCDPDADLNAVLSIATQSIVNLLAPGLGTLGWSLIRDDISNAIRSVAPQVQYVQNIKPDLDVLVSRTQYIRLGRLTLNAYFSTRQKVAH